jgi:hypothetical protein
LEVTKYGVVQVIKYGLIQVIKYVVTQVLCSPPSMTVWVFDWERNRHVRGLVWVWRLGER